LTDGLRSVLPLYRMMDGPVTLGTKRNAMTPVRRVL